MEDLTPTSNNALGSTSSKSLDPGRKYVKQDPTNNNNFFSNFCGVRATKSVFQLERSPNIIEEKS